MIELIFAIPLIVYFIVKKKVKKLSKEEIKLLICGLTEIIEATLNARKKAFEEHNWENFLIADKVLSEKIAQKNNLLNELNSLF
ncbi:MAG TPA: hypothetical protein VGB37_17455 [Candidatus Lokiarchaeia archaeon]